MVIVKILSTHMKRLLSTDTESDKNDKTQFDQIFNLTNANHFMDLGEAHAQLGQLQEAVVPFKKATEFAPTKVIAFYRLGDAHLKLGEFQKAATPLKKATELAPTNAMYFNDLGTTYFTLGKFQEALAAYKNATDLPLTNAIAFNNLGRAHAQLGEFQEAIVAFEKAINLDPTYARAFYHLGKVHAQLGQLQKAVATHKTATDLDESKAIYFNNLGDAHFKLGEFQEALVPFKKAIELDPTSPLPTIALITPSHSAKEVREIITKVIIPGNKFIIDSSTDKSLVEKAKTNIADAMVKYTTTTPVGKSTFLDIALKLYLEIGTEKTLDKVCVISKNNNFSSEKQAEMLYTVGNVYSSKGIYVKALVEYKKSIALNPKFLDSYIQAKAACIALGQNEEAQTYKTQAYGFFESTLVVDTLALDAEIQEQNSVIDLLGDI